MLQIGNEKTMTVKEVVCGSVDDIILRCDAKKLGLKTYFTGKPCKNGHVSKRITLNGHCGELYTIQ